MKTLKIRLGLLSLLAVLAVSVFLTSCEQEEIISTSHIELDKYFEEFDIIELDVANIYNVVSAYDRGTSFKMMLSNGTETPWNLTLTRNSVIANDSKGQEVNGRATDISNIVTLNGYLNDNTEDVVRLVVTEKLIGGFVNDGEFSYRIEPLAKYTPGSAKMSESIIYEENAYKYNDVEVPCSQQSNSDYNNNNDQLVDLEELNTKSGFAHTLELRLYTDKAYFNDVSAMFPNASVADRLNVARFFVALYVNGTSAKYHNSMNLELVIKHIVTLITDSFVIGNDVRTLNTQLRNHINNLSNVRNHQDAVVLITNKKYTSGKAAGTVGFNGGIPSGIGSICRHNNTRSYTTVRTYRQGSNQAYSSSFRENLLAHEIGHLIGSPHTKEENGTVNCGLTSPFNISGVYSSTNGIMNWAVPSGANASFFPCSHDYMNINLWFHSGCL